MKLTQEDFEREMDHLAEKIDYTPDIIVGIARGGLRPARALCSRLGVKDMYPLKVKKEGGERKVIGTDVDVSGKSVLLVEDMLETGRGLDAVEKYLQGKGADVRTACLYTMPISEVAPNYFLREVDEVVKFPWE